MKAIVTEDCILCGACADICPEVFDVSEGDIARVIVDIIPEELKAKAKEACEACPVDAITLED